MCISFLHLVAEGSDEVFKQWISFCLICFRVVFQISHTDIAYAYEWWMKVYDTVGGNKTDDDTNPRYT